MNLKSIARSAGAGLSERHGPVHVLVDLKTRTAEPECLDRLEAYGLAVDEVIGNKVLGTIEGESLPSLRRDPAVAEVEVSSCFARTPSEKGVASGIEPGALAAPDAPLPGDAATLDPPG